VTKPSGILQAFRPTVKNRAYYTRHGPLIETLFESKLLSPGLSASMDSATNGFLLGTVARVRVWIPRKASKDTEQ
jgi:hypothetical protein